MRRMRYLVYPCKILESADSSQKECAELQFGAQRTTTVTLFKLLSTRRRSMAQWPLVRPPEYERILTWGEEARAEDPRDANARGVPTCIIRHRVLALGATHRLSPLPPSRFLLLVLHSFYFWFVLWGFFLRFSILPALNLFFLFPAGENDDRSSNTYPGLP